MRSTMVDFFLPLGIALARRLASANRKGRSAPVRREGAARAGVLPALVAVGVEFINGLIDVAGDQRAAPGQAAADAGFRDQLSLFVDLADLATGVDPDVMAVGKLAGVVGVPLRGVVENGFAFAREFDDALVSRNDGVAVGQALDAGWSDARVFPTLVAARVHFVDEAVP